MRGKRKELADAVLAAALAVVALRSQHAKGRVEGAVFDAFIEALSRLQTEAEEYNAYDAAVITGAGARWAEGSETSRQAAAMAAPRQGSVRHQIVAHLANVPPLAHPGYTDRQLERRIGASHQTVSSARNWLCEAGWLEDSGQRRLTNDRPAAVWQLSPAAHRQLTTPKGTG